MKQIKSSGKQSANSVNGSSTQITGHSTTVNNYSMNENLEDFYKSSHIKAIDIIKSQRLVISKLQHQIDRMQDQIDSTQEIKKQTRSNANETFGGKMICG